MKLSERLAHDTQCAGGYDKDIACDCRYQIDVVEVRKLEDTASRVPGLDEWGAELEAENEKLRAEMAGMLLVEAEGESFAETIVRENKRLTEWLEGHAEYDMDGKPINWVAEALDA